MLQILYAGVLLKNIISHVSDKIKIIAFVIRGF